MLSLTLLWIKSGVMVFMERDIMRYILLYNRPSKLGGGDSLKRGS